MSYNIRPRYAYLFTIYIKPDDAFNQLLNRQKVNRRTRRGVLSPWRTRKTGITYINALKWLNQTGVAYKYSVEMAENSHQRTLHLQGIIITSKPLKKSGFGADIKPYGEYLNQSTHLTPVFDLVGAEAYVEKSGKHEDKAHTNIGYRHGKMLTLESAGWATVAADTPNNTLPLLYGAAYTDPETTKRRVLELWQRGLSKSKIAKLLKFSLTHICEIIKENPNLISPPLATQQELKEQAHQEYRAATMRLVEMKSLPEHQNLFTNLFQNIHEKELVKHFTTKPLWNQIGLVAKLREDYEKARLKWRESLEYIASSEQVRSIGSDDIDEIWFSDDYLDDWEADLEGWEDDLDLLLE